jgi:hypothetical protein
MGGEISSKLSILSRISNLSSRFGRKKKTARRQWLEARRDLEAACGTLGRDDELELRARLAEQEASARASGLYDLPPPGEMTQVRKRRR